MSIFRRNPEVSAANSACRTANREQQDYARTSGNRDENDPTYLELNARTNTALTNLRAAKRRG